MKRIIFSILALWAFNVQAQLSITANIGYGHQFQFESPGFFSKISLDKEINSKWSAGISFSNFLSESEGLFANRGDTLYAINDKEKQSPFGSFWNIGGPEDGLVLYDTKPNKFSASSASLNLGRKLFFNKKNQFSAKMGLGISYVDLVHMDYFQTFDHVDNDNGSKLDAPVLFPIFRYQTFLDFQVGAGIEYFRKVKNRLWIGGNANFDYMTSSKYSIAQFGLGIRVH